jgi:Flp pilus assembly protein TadG
MRGSSMRIGVGPGSPWRSVPRFLHGRDGTRATAVIEFSFIAPVVVLMMVCAVDLGLGTYRNMQVQMAAQAGAQYAMVHGFNPGAVASAVTGATTYTDVTVTPAPSQFCGCTSAAGVAVNACNASCPEGGAPGTYVIVSAQATYTPLLPYPLLPAAFNLTAQSTVRTQ